MKVGVTSQNFRTITGHAGKTRRFLVYRASDAGILEIDRLDLPREMSMHEFSGVGIHPLDDLDVLITASCGDGFRNKMARRGVEVLLTSEEDPERAVSTLLAGGAAALPPPAPHEHHSHH
ncbi:MAG: NifB/NifX family molybdenum-iron cluster-binding protein [Hyphomicrobiales bacterium]